MRGRYLGCSNFSGPKKPKIWNCKIARETESLSPSPALMTWQGMTLALQNVIWKGEFPGRSTGDFTGVSHQQADGRSWLSGFSGILFQQALQRGWQHGQMRSTLPKHRLWQPQRDESPATARWARNGSTGALPALCREELSSCLQVATCKLFRVTGKLFLLWLLSIKTKGFISVIAVVSNLRVSKAGK